jgi:hypothetical protein
MGRRIFEVGLPNLYLKGGVFGFLQQGAIISPYPEHSPLQLVRYELFYPKML